jgi:polyisoprenoid-binding protein YceI
MVRLVSKKEGIMKAYLPIAAIALLFSTALASAQTVYSVDAIHSSVLFRLMHADTAPFYGRFNRVSGTIKSDANAPTEIDVVVEAGSVDTNQKDRDEHLRGPDFFDIKQFPDIRFKSTGVKKSDDSTFEVTGDLTLHGTTKPITVTFKRTGMGKNAQGKDVIGFETTFTIKRSEFGVSGYVGKGLGDDTTLIIALELIKQ